MHWLIDMTFRRASRWFLAAILAILPLVITVAVITWVGALVAQFLGPSAVIGQALRGVGFQFATNETAAYVVGAAFGLVLIFLVGAVVEPGAKSLVQRLLDVILQRIPIIVSVYGTSKQLVGLVVSIMLRLAGGKHCGLVGIDHRRDASQSDDQDGMIQGLYDPFVVPF